MAENSNANSTASEASVAAGEASGDPASDRRWFRLEALRLAVQCRAADRNSRGDVLAEAERMIGWLNA